MSVDQLPPPKMPQPEQWLSEHPWVLYLLLVVAVLILVAAFR